MTKKPSIPPKKNRTKKPRSLLFKIAIGIVIIMIVIVGRYFFYPSVSWYENHNPTTTSFIEFRKEQWVAKNKPRKLRMVWVSYSQISPTLIRALILSEDAKFWQHDGFDFEAINDAIITDIKAGKFKIGASTITQQLAKNLFLKPTKNPIRKISEAILTWRLERTLSKKRILELYCNIAEWGDGIFGIEAAAQFYFHKSASGLTAEESARLVAVLPNPIRFSPLSQTSRFVVRRTSKLVRGLGTSLPPDSLASTASHPPVQAPRSTEREDTVSDVWN